MRGLPPGSQVYTPWVGVGLYRVGRAVGSHRREVGVGPVRAGGTVGVLTSGEIDE